MKTLKLYTLIFAILVLAQQSFAQAPVVASAATTPTTPTTPEAVTEEPAAKEEDEPTFTLSGSIDTYARSSFGTTNPFAGGAYAPSSSFANQKGFGIGMVNLIASYGGEKVGFTADLVFGPRGRDAVFGSASGQGIVNQMFAYYKLGKAVTLNMGQFNTFLGYEVISPAVNFHYSTSYLFSWGPFNHTGVRADFDLGGGMVAKLAVMNPTDIVEFNPVNTYTLGAQIGHTSDAGGIWLNFLYGDQDGELAQEDITEDVTGSAGKLFQGDVTLGFNLSDKFYLGFNSSYQAVGPGQTVTNEGILVDADGDATSFFGLAVYPKVTVSEKFAIGVRGEYFSVSKGHLGIIGTDTDGNGSVFATTLTANYKVGGLTIIPEFRMDTTSEKSFVDSNGKAIASMPSLTLAAVYKF